MSNVPPVQPGSLPPGFALKPCTGSDVEGLIHIYFDSFATNPANMYWWSRDRDTMLDWMRSRIVRKLRDPSCRNYKMVDVSAGPGGPEPLVAWARWDIPAGPQHEAAFGAWQAPEGLDDYAAVTLSADPYPAGADSELCRGFFEGLERMSDRWGAGGMLGLSLLGVAPAYHRRGVARAMLEPMLAAADGAGVRAYLESTPAARPFYERFGFREADALEFDLDRLTDDMHGVYRLAIMIREPRQGQ